MKKIDVNNWSRKQQYLFYKDFDVPQYHLTVEMDVTHFLQYVKDNNLSFYLSFMYVLMLAINEIEAFKYRIIENQVYLCDQVHPSFTDVVDGTDNFKIVTCNLKNDVFSFINHAKRTSMQQGDLFIDMESEKRVDLVYVTTVPWYHYTQVTHAHNLDNRDAIPRIVWGKFETKEEKSMMPLSMEVHHAFVDGIHLGQFLDILQKRLNEL
ncbi:MAG: chloramphenicol acetyltransferase [Acholeplasmataceae bacterium]|nr:chloramphenicol acetyltransferase [Acholeplasmataceae bacterium]